MKTQRIKATYTMLPLIGCPGAKGASWALPADAESYERMVEQMAKAMLLTWNAGTRQYECVKDAARISAHAALKSIGVVPPRTGRGGKGTK